MNRRSMFGAMAAVAAASLVLGNTGFADEKKAGDTPKAEKKTVKCMGGNACAGKGECGAADGSHACGGKNSCKGKGWVMMSTEKDCTAANGKVAKKEDKNKT